MGQLFSTRATAASGTKAASCPHKRYGSVRRLRCFTEPGEGTVEVIETWGSFARVARPGLRPVWCCLGQGVAGRLDTALQHQEVQCECQTADGVFVEIVLSVQYRVAEERIYEAFYSLADPVAQVTSYVLDAVGTAVATLELQDLFRDRAGLVAAVQRGLGSVLRDHGYALQDCLITVLAPTASLKEAMTNVKAAQRQREAAVEQGEADKLRTVKHAEASSESKYLQGQGLARFFVAFAAGMRESLKVLVTGRIRQEDIAFPPPPPAESRAALEAAGVELLPPATPGQEDGSAQQGRQQGKGTACPAGAAGSMGAYAGSEPRKPALPALPALPAHPSQLEARIGQPALLAPQVSLTPSRYAAPVAPAAAFSGGASAAKIAANL